MGLYLGQCPVVTEHQDADLYVSDVMNIYRYGQGELITTGNDNVTGPKVRPIFAIFDIFYQIEFSNNLWELTKNTYNTILFYLFFSFLQKFSVPGNLQQSDWILQQSSSEHSEAMRGPI